MTYDRRETMKCAGCQSVLDVGDRYIEDTASGFINQAPNPAVDDLLAGILGGSNGKVIYCEDCTQDGGDYLFDTVYGDEES